MAGRGKEASKSIAIIVSVLVIIVLVGTLFVLFHGAHTGG